MDRRLLDAWKGATFRAFTLYARCCPGRLPANRRAGFSSTHRRPKPPSLSSSPSSNVLMSVLPGSSCPAVRGNLQKALLDEQTEIVLPQPASLTIFLLTDFGVSRDAPAALPDALNVLPVTLTFLLQTKAR